MPLARITLSSAQRCSVQRRIRGSPADFAAADPPPCAGNVSVAGSAAAMVPPAVAVAAVASVADFKKSRRSMFPPPYAFLSSAGQWRLGDPARGIDEPTLARQRLTRKALHHPVRGEAARRGPEIRRR